MPKKVFISILAISLIGILLIPIAGFAHRVGRDTEEVHRVIEVLYDLDPEDVHAEVVHNHNNYEVPRWFAPKPCDGYEGGHSGYDVAHEDDDARFYSLTDGEVINLKHPTNNIKDLSYISIYNSAHNKTIFYLHPSYIDVRIGDRVEVGDYLGKQGATGIATGPHIHLEVRRNRSVLASCGAGASKHTNRPNENPIPFLYDQAKDFKEAQIRIVNRPDLVVEVELESITLEPGDEFRLYSTLKNRGTEESEATILRYYSSSNDRITSNDEQLGRGFHRPSLDPNETIRRYLRVTVPETPGTYYYGVCVDAVDNESDTANNCSEAISVIVRSPDANAADVNGDGIVDVEDLIWVAEEYGEKGNNDADVNGDGKVDIDDLILVAEAIDDTANAPAIRPQVQAFFTEEQLRELLTETKLRKNISPSHQRGLTLLEQLFRLSIPKKTALLVNYPNPFNPETWIPYHLAEASTVLVHIYDVRGRLVRFLQLGHQAAGYYTNKSRAAYWDGKNQLGESVASGVYFYTFTAGDFSATGKMLIRK